VPVHVGGIAIYPNDLLHADCNGVTTIPIEIADELADIGDEFIAAEAVILNGLREPNPTPKRLAELRAESGERIGKLRARVSHARR
jgi:regulator of RNase E activity RraA